MITTHSIISNARDMKKEYSKAPNYTHLFSSLKMPSYSVSRVTYHSFTRFSVNCVNNVVIIGKTI